MKFSTTIFEQIPIVGILRGFPAKVLPNIMDAYLEAGFKTIEITMNSEGAEEMIQFCAERYAEQLNIGAGTVRSVKELERALGAGASFIVTPIIDVEVIQECVNAKIPIFPGAYTPTEVYSAWKAGATAVKVFPAVTGGLTHIKAIKAPLEMIPIIPTGGVSADNLAQFFDLGIYGVGMGSQLFPKSVIQQEDWQGLTEQLQGVKQAYDNWKQA